MSPSRSLRPYVASLHVYDVDLGEPGVHRGLPGTTVTLVLALDDPLDVAWGEGRGRQRGWSTLAGLHGGPAYIRHDGHQRGVQLELTPAGARALLGLPSGALAGGLFRLGDAVPRLGTLAERVAEAPFADVRALVESTLVEELARLDAAGPRAEVGRALAQLTRGAPVGEVADEVGYSARRLRALVAAECGVGPGEFRRLARFERAKALLGREPFAQVAARCGYADQAHLSREWREFAGCTPSTWVREEFRIVQDSADGAGAE